MKTAPSSAVRALDEKLQSVRAIKQAIARLREPKWSISLPRLTYNIDKRRLAAFHDLEGSFERRLKLAGIGDRPG